MNGLSALAVGHRFNAAHCRLVKTSTYQVQRQGKDCTIFRHVFQTIHGETLVYSGSRMVAHAIGSCYYIRATVKRHEPAHGCIRIARPIVEREDRGSRLL